MHRSADQFGTDLPTKIAGIVFWGLVLIGAFLSLLLLQLMDDYLRGQHAVRADALVDEVVRPHLEAHENIGTSLGGKPLSAWMDEHGFVALQVQLRSGDTLYGAIPSGVGPLTRELYFEERDGGYQGHVRLQLYPADLEAQITAHRKQLFLMMGGLFLLFGFILQWVLKRVLTNPFANMISVAKAFTDGDAAQRFDEQRADEFGFLGTFINQALDHVTLQQDELRAMLERMRASEQALHHEKERAEVTLHSIGDGVIATDPAGRVDYMNPVAERLIGNSLAACKGRSLHEVLCLLDEDTHQPLQDPVQRCLREGGERGAHSQSLLVRDNGEELPVAHTAAPMRDSAGELLGVVMAFRDEGQARRLAKQLSYQAAHDALTGLYNRREFEQRLQLAVDSARCERREHVVCYLDLDQFKVVNDTCGHIAGDELLRQLAIILQNQVRDTDVLARLGGDEFGILLQYCSLEQGRGIAEALRRAVSDFRFAYQDHCFEVGVSIGMVAVNESSRDLAEVLSRADIACYAAKDCGRDRIHVFQPDDHELEKRRGEMRWVSRIRKALEEDRFQLATQEIVALQRQAEPHFEFLIRMQDEQGDSIPPMAFIPAAERYDLMPSIDRWVVEKVLGSRAALDVLPEGSVLTLNLSGQSIGDERFLETVLQLLASSQVPASQVCFEITETAAIANLRFATRFIKSVRAHGCQFALDDFGSGLSSFAYLKNLDVDYLKIDGSFVRDMIEDPIDFAMVKAIHQIGHVMGIATIAEFVENEQTLEQLRELGVDFAQGYWIGKPQLLALNIPSSDRRDATGSHGDG